MQNCKKAKIIGTIFSVIFLHFLSTATSYGQESQISFGKMTVENGLSQNSVISISQDKLGVLWFATQDGLNRYDGFSVEKYVEYFDDITKPDYSRLGKIFIDHEDNIWLITKAGVLKRYSSYMLEKREFKAIASVNSIFQDHLNQLIIGTWNNGLYLLDPEAGTTKPLQSINKKLGNDTITSVIQDIKKRYWIGTSSGLYHTDDLEKHCEKVAFENPNSTTSISTMAVDHQNRLWVGTFKNGLFFKDTKSKTLKSILPKKGSSFPANLASLNILSLLVDRLNRIWAGTYGDGLILISNDGNIEQFTLKKNNPNSISYNDILYLFEDSNEVIWAGTDGGGVSFYDENLHKFNSYTNANVPDNIHVDVIRSILVDSDQQVWLGTSGYGLTIYDPQGTEKWISINTNNSKLSNDRIMSLSEDQNHRIWIGTQGNGIDIFDPKFNSFKNFSESKRRAYLPDHTVWTVYHDTQNRHWVGTRDGGLCLFDEREGVLKQYIPENSGIPGSSVRVIIQENENTLWIGTESNGLCRFKIETEEFKIYKANDQNKNALSSNLIKSLHFYEGFLWVGTSGGGLNVLDVEHDDLRTFTTADGLPNEVIYAILRDGNNNLWLSTNRGISKFTPPKNIFERTSFPKIVNYDNYDGLQGLEFNSGASFKDRNGYLYFGGINGYNWFLPENIILNQKSSKAILNSIEISGIPVNSDTIVSRIKTLELNHSENALSFSFTTLNFSMPFRNTYKYKLEGYDDEWISSGTRNYASYTNLEPGTYSFGVFGGNYDGVFHDQPTELQITINSPWWQTMWAYSIGIILLYISGISVYRFQLNRWKLQTQLQLEQQEAERLKELDLFKSKLYTNITHEFRTPLTVILGLVEKGREYFANKDIKKFNNINDIVQRNTHGLLNLVNQILDLSRLETNSIDLKMINADVVLFLKRLVGMYDSHAENYNLTLNYTSSIPELFMDFDPDNLQKIVTNLLSNSIKFTDKGNVNLSVSEKIVNEKKHIYVSVKDTGIGIAEKDLSSIFQRFFQAENPEKKSIIGSGIGMALVKELVELMDGEVSIKSILGIGTEVTFSLPIRNNVKVISQAESILADKLFGLIEVPENQDAEPVLDGKQIILTIEDNKDVQFYLKTCLQDHYFVITASNGDEGVLKALEFVPDIIISDVMMPGKTGYEVCETLKQDTRTSHIPIILLTAKVEMQDKISGLKHGADAYLHKPFNVEELLVQVENLIKTRAILFEKFGKAGFDDTKISLLPEKENEFLKEIKALILEELTNPELNVDKVCETLHMSRTQLHRKIKALTNKSITAYIRSFRLQRAKELIQKSNLTIQQIAFETGFSDSSYFHRSFVKEFNKKPTDFRN